MQVSNSTLAGIISEAQFTTIGLVHVTANRGAGISLLRDNNVLLGPSTAIKSRVYSNMGTGVRLGARTTVRNLEVLRNGGVGLELQGKRVSYCPETTPMAYMHENARAIIPFCTRDNVMVHCIYMWCTMGRHFAQSTYATVRNSNLKYTLCKLPHLNAFETGKHVFMREALSHVSIVIPDETRDKHRFFV